VRLQKAGGDPAAAPLRRDGNRQDFRFVGRDADRMKPQMFFFGFDRAVGEGPGATKSCSKSPPARIGEARRVDGGAFRAPLGPIGRMKGEALAAN